MNTTATTLSPPVPAARDVGKPAALTWPETTPRWPDSDRSFGRQTLDRTRPFVSVSAALRKKLGKNVGDEVEVRIAR